MDNFLNELESLGIKGQVMPIECLNGLEEMLEGTKKRFSDISTYLGRYLEKFNYSSYEEFYGAKSIIVVASESPITKVFFNKNGKTYTEIIPPTYLYNCSPENEGVQKRIGKINEAINSLLEKRGYRAVKTNLPCKASAVLSGLGKYGKNNLCYIEGMGSYAWIGVYLSDYPAGNFSTPESFLMEDCENCRICQSNCPSQSFSEERFPIIANRCITYMNESENDFPAWVDKSWHNSLIGCMRCQIVCPKNKDLSFEPYESVTFSEEETENILKGFSIENLAEETYEKLKVINFIEDYKLLSRNLGCLMEK